MIQSEHVATMIGRPVQRLERVHGGGNNQIYRVDLENDECLALKSYSTEVENDRLRKEFESFRFLHHHGERAVPKPHVCDIEQGLGFYEWVKGERVERATEKEIDGLLEFIARLVQLAKRPEARALPDATDAVFSATDLIEQVENRLRRFAPASLENESLSQFIQHSFLTRFNQIKSLVESRYKALGLSIDAPISKAQRTLSPSDFGFHNALRRQDNSLVFLDFEYFGWDDPVAMVSDFLWHPAMDLTFEMKQRFVTGVANNFSDDETWKARLTTLFPLFGLVWILIILNEFLPAVWARRLAAGRVQENEKLKIQQAQLEKAERYLRRVAEAEEQFPYVF